MADEIGYTLSRSNYDRVRRTVLAYEGQPRVGARRRRRPPVFQPGAATKVYQAVSGLRLRRTTPAKPEDTSYFEPVVITVEIGDTSGNELRNLRHQDVAEIYDVLLARGVINSQGLVIGEVFDDFSTDEKILSITEEQLGKRIGVTALRSRWCSGYIGMGSMLVGNGTEAFYGLGKQIFRATIREAIDDDDNPGLYVAALQHNTAAINHETTTESLGDLIVVRDQFGEESFLVDGSEVQVTFNQQNWMDDDTAYQSEFWYDATSAPGFFPVFEVLNPPSIVVGVPTAITQAANSVEFTIYAGTSGAQSATTQTVSVYVRRGIVFTNTLYDLHRIDGDWEVGNPSLSFIGKTDAQITKGSGGTVSLWSGNHGSEADVTSVNVSSCFNRFATIATTKFVLCVWKDGTSGSGWEIVAAEC